MRAASPADPRTSRRAGFLATAARLSARPVDSSSMTVTLSPRDGRASVRLEPMKRAPQVMRTLATRNAQGSATGCEDLHCGLKGAGLLSAEAIHCRAIAIGYCEQPAACLGWWQFLYPVGGHR